MSAAHELRINKRQADWTPDDIASFTAHNLTRSRSQHEPGEGVHAFPVIQFDNHPVTEAELLEIAGKGLQTLVAMRTAEPAKSLPIFATVLLTTGSTLTTLTSGENRIKILKLLARTQPVFGYFIVFDAFIHSISPTRATKRDALLAHIGTRDLRIMKSRPYTVDAGVVHFDDPPPADINKRAPEAPLQTVDDPYAAIFATPLQTGRPS